LLAEFTARDLLHESQPVATSTSVADLLDHVLSERRTSFPVVDGGAPLGVVTLDHARSVAEGDRSTTTVGDVMDRSVATVTPDRDAFEVILEMGEHGQDTVFVVEDGELLGVITQADIAAAIEVVQGVGPRQQPMPDPPEGYA
jgi:predicted transcriptional regulator